MKRLEADMINGVYEVTGLFNADTDEYDNEEMFFEALSEPFEGTIGCIVTDEMFEKITAKFGEIR